MKRKYERPTTEVYCFQSLLHIMESSYISIEGEGKFDVKTQYNGWEIEWNKMPQEEEEKEVFFIP